LVLLDGSLNVEQFIRSKTTTPVHAHRFNPELGNLAIALDMNMRRFAAIIRIEKESVGTYSKSRRHTTKIVSVLTFAIRGF